MLLPDFLFHAPQGSIRLTGHRIALEHVVHFYSQGFSPEMLLEQFPSLPLALIHKVIAFYLENQADVDAYVASNQAECDQLAAAVPASPSLIELRQRMQQPVSHPNGQAK